jgi:uncharacterized membrane protein YphA (DoxX/SURF4 family)
LWRHETRYQIAPVFILVGFSARLAALLIVADMLVAILMVLHTAIFSVNQMGGLGNRRRRSYADVMCSGIILHGIREVCHFVFR